MNKRRLTSGFTQAGVYARRQFCVDLEVCRPPEPLWNPRLREAATTLAASGGQRGVVIKCSFDSVRVDNVAKFQWNCTLYTLTILVES